MLSPQLAESFVLAVAVSWCVLLHRRRQAGRVTLFMALYLALPAVGLFCQGLGFVTVTDTLNWLTVIGNASLTATFIASTRHADSEVVHAMVTAERNIVAREARVRAYTLAAVVLRDLPPEPRGASRSLHAAVG